MDYLFFRDRLIQIEQDPGDHRIGRPFRRAGAFGEVDRPVGLAPGDDLPGAGPAFGEVALLVVEELEENGPLRLGRASADAPAEGVGQRSASVAPPSARALRARALDASTAMVSFRVTRAWSGVFDRTLRTHEVFPSGTSKVERRG